MEGRLAFANDIAVENNPYDSSQRDSADAWTRGWREAQNKRSAFVHGRARNLGFFIYSLGAVITGSLGFVASWVYAIATYGFFLGVGLGWVPSLVIGLLVGLLWPVAAILLAIILVLAFGVLGT